MLKIAFIVHAKSKNKKNLLSQIETHFRAPEYEVGVFETEYSQHSILLAETAVKNGYTHLIACGGDGTVNEVLNGIIKSGNMAIQLGLLPHGSGNDFIKTIKAPATVSGLKECIEKQLSKKIDIGFAEFNSKDGQKTNRYFLNITDIGMGGVIAQQLFHSKKLFGSTITYQYLIIKNLLQYTPQPVQVTGDNFTYKGSIMNFCAANAQYFGSGLCVAPTAELNDGLLNAVAIGNVSLLDYFLNLPAIKKGHLLKHPEVKYYTSKTLLFESNTPNMAIDMDGEFVGFLPLKIEVKPQFINFIA